MRRRGRWPFLLDLNSVRPNGAGVRVCCGVRRRTGAGSAWPSCSSRRRCSSTLRPPQRRRRARSECCFTCCHCRRHALIWDQRHNAALSLFACSPTGTGAPPHSEGVTFPEWRAITWLDTLRHRHMILKSFCRLSTERGGTVSRLRGRRTHSPADWLLDCIIRLILVTASNGRSCSKQAEEHGAAGRHGHILAGSGRIS